MIQHEATQSRIAPRGIEELLALGDQELAEHSLTAASSEARRQKDIRRDAWVGAATIGQEIGLKDAEDRAAGAKDRFIAAVRAREESFSRNAACQRW